METPYTPIESLLGGSLIGLAAVLLMLTLGRIFGATGILSGLVFFERKSELNWRIPLVAGMVLAPITIRLISGEWPAVNVTMHPIAIAIGGVIVGFGASLGSGCPSGHGVCGISRLSLRSIVAVPTFMATAAITVFIIRHVIGA